MVNDEALLSALANMHPDNAGIESGKPDESDRGSARPDGAEKGSASVDGSVTPLCCFA